MIAEAVLLTNIVVETSAAFFHFGKNSFADLRPHTFLHQQKLPGLGMGFDALRLLFHACGNAALKIDVAKQIIFKDHFLSNAQQRF